VAVNPAVILFVEDQFCGDGRLQHTLPEKAPRRFGRQSGYRCIGSFLTLSSLQKQAVELDEATIGEAFSGRDETGTRSGRAC